MYRSTERGFGNSHTEIFLCFFFFNARRAGEGGGGDASPSLRLQQYSICSKHQYGNVKSTVFSATEHFPLVCMHVPTVLKVVVSLFLFVLRLLLILLLLLLLLLILLLQLLLLPLLLLLVPLLQLRLLLLLLLPQLLQILLALRQEDGAALGVQLHPDPGLSLSRVYAGVEGRQGFEKTVLGRR